MWCASRGGASMRPRHYAGESAMKIETLGSSPESFNEAPALRRGKSPPVVTDVGDDQVLQ